MGLIRGGVRIAAGLGLGLAVGCGPATGIAIHPTASTRAWPDGPDPDAVESSRERHAAVARDVAITATLWDAALLAAAVDRARQRGDDEATLHRRQERWTTRYLTERTSFTVVIELANRQPESEGRDPLIDPAAWTFALDRGGVRDLPALAVELEGIDRFPTSAGGHHVRLAFVVHFASEASSDAPHAGEPLRLRVRTSVAEHGSRRRELGARIARRGAALSWRVGPD